MSLVLWYLTAVFGTRKMFNGFWPPSDQKPKESYCPSAPVIIPSKANEAWKSKKKSQTEYFKKIYMYVISPLQVGHRRYPIIEPNIFFASLRSCAC